MKLILKIIYNICIIVLLILSISSCSKIETVLSGTEYDKKIGDLSKVNENTEKKIEEDRLRFQLKLAEEKIDDYENLVSNLNSYLKNVYYGKANKGPNKLEGFTAFSIKYKGNYYLITAGHCVGKDKYRQYNNHQFRANLDDEWIMPFLMLFDSGNGCHKDYAVFHSPHINDGLEIDPDYNGEDMLVLGNNFINTLRQNDKGALEGESGSPIINLDGEVVGLITAGDGSYTGISLVIEKIDAYEYENQPIFSDNFYRMYKKLLKKANQESPD